MRLKLVGRIGFEPLNSQFAHSASSAVDSSLETAGTESSRAWSIACLDDKLSQKRGGCTEARG